MKFNAGEIASVIKTEIEGFRGQIQTSEVGRVVEVGDGIARVYGLSTAMAGEMVEFTKSGVRGQVFNLEENSVGVIILGDYLKVTEADFDRAASYPAPYPAPSPAVSGHQEPSTLHEAREKSLDVAKDAETQYPRQGSNKRGITREKQRKRPPPGANSGTTKRGSRGAGKTGGRKPANGRKRGAR